MADDTITQEILYETAEKIRGYDLRVFPHYKGDGPELSYVEIITDPLGVADMGLAGIIEYEVADLISKQYGVAFGSHDFSRSHKPAENHPVFSARAKTVEELERSIENLRVARGMLNSKLKKLAMYAFNL
jgi:hypothetical protein